MTKEFDNVAALMEAIRRDFSGVLEAAEPALAEAGAEIKDRAQQKLGLYNAGWEQLKDETQAARERKGFSPNEPLLVTGHLRDSITFEVGPGRVRVGVKSEGSPDIGVIAEVQELGNGHIPPRPFLVPALHENRDYIGRLISESIVKTFRRKIG